jgi:signal transduction histidine kinase
MAAAGAIPLRSASISVDTLLGSIQKVMEPQARALDVTLTIQIAEDTPRTVHVDADKIAWALTALIGNALRYVRHGTSRMPGGSISLRATRDEAGGVAIDVQDDGPGIPPDRILLVAAEDSDVGRGGLARGMVRDVVRAHGGRFDITSRTDAFGHGTTIRLTLPAA